MTKKTNSAIIYDGWYDAAKELEQENKELAYDYLMAILETQFFGEHKNTPIINALMVNVDFSLLRQMEKRNAASIGGLNSPHNRKLPYALIYYLKKISKVDDDTICEITGCSKRSISNAVNGAQAAIDSGSSIEELMQSEQDDVKYKENYAKYFSHVQSTLL